MSYFIHHYDPSFVEPPWPGVRRLGPFETLEEAQAQAESDAANGYGVPIGIFSEDESEKLSDKGENEQENGEASVTKETIIGASDLMKEAFVKNRLDSIAQDRSALESILPEGITIEDIESVT